MLMRMRDDKVVYFGILKVVSTHCSVVHLVSVIVMYVWLCSNFSETSYFVKWSILVLYAVFYTVFW